MKKSVTYEVCLAEPKTLDAVFEVLEVAVNEWEECKDLVQRLCDQDSTASMEIPSDISVEDYWKRFSSLCRATGVMHRASMKLRPLMGRMLAIASDNPKYYREKGFKNWENFLGAIEQQFGVERSTAYDAMRIFRAFPSLPPSKWESVGTTKLLTMATAMTENNSDYDHLLGIAESGPRSKIVEYLESHGYKTKAEMEGATIVIQTNRDIADHWEAFTTDGRVQSTCQTKHKAEILEHMMQECEGSWLGE
jgi:hypothetical protein